MGLASRTRSPSIVPVSSQHLSIQVVPTRKDARCAASGVVAVLVKELEEAGLVLVQKHTDREQNIILVVQRELAHHLMWLWMIGLGEDRV
jgi:hypothetical protein